MGNDISQESESSPPELPEFLLHTKSGYRILAIQSQSPASSVGLVPIFDFIVQADDRPLLAEDGTFTSIIREFENRLLTITVYNSKCRKLRNLSFTPCKNWGGEGLLGLTIKFDSFDGSEDSVIHVLDVNPDSPAEKAGLVEDVDYIIGTPYMVFENLDELYDLVADSVGDHEDGQFEELELYIYNMETDMIRKVFLTPSQEWGGEGVLGCGVGHGFLHRIPRRMEGSPGIAAADFIAEKKEEMPDAINTVETPYGPGVLCGTRANGMQVVHLGWGLANGSIAIAQLQKENVRMMKKEPGIAK